MGLASWRLGKLARGFCRTRRLAACIAIDIATAYLLWDFRAFFIPDIAPIIFIFTNVKVPYSRRSVCARSIVHTPLTPPLFLTPAPSLCFLKPQGEAELARTRSDGGSGTPLEQHLMRHGIPPSSSPNGSPVADDDSVHSGTALNRPSTDVAHTFGGPPHHRAGSHTAAGVGAGGGGGGDIDGLEFGGSGGGGAHYGFVYGRPYGAAPLPEVELGGVGGQPGAGGAGRAGGVGDSVGLLGAGTARSDAAPGRAGHR